MASNKSTADKFFKGDSNHGLAKRVILKKTLQAWIPYHLYKGYDKLYYIDGFSGKGVYGEREVKQDKETPVENYGSPVIALDCTLDCFNNVTKSFEIQEEERGISPEKLAKSPSKTCAGTKYG